MPKFCTTKYLDSRKLKVESNLFDVIFVSEFEEKKQKQRKSLICYYILVCFIINIASQVNYIILKTYHVIK